MASSPSHPHPRGSHNTPHGLLIHLKSLSPSYGLQISILSHGLLDTYLIKINSLTADGSVFIYINICLCHCCLFLNLLNSKLMVYVVSVIFKIEVVSKRHVIFKAKNISDNLQLILIGSYEDILTVSYVDVITAPKFNNGWFWLALAGKMILFPEVLGQNQGYRDGTMAD